MEIRLGAQIICISFLPLFFAEFIGFEGELNIRLIDCDGAVLDELATD